MSAPDKQKQSPQVQAAPRPSDPTVTLTEAHGVGIAAKAVSVDASSVQFPVSGWDRYEFLELLGRGGMGVVYKARDRHLGRNVALKFIRDADSTHVMRLLQEARTQARIDHPNVCKVYEVGEVEGKAYIAMQLMAGEQLGRAASKLSLADKVWVMKEVAAAVHEAHRFGVIHRDLKPSNILVERAESGQWVPVVMDFGLAYEVNQGHGLTQTGTVMGTPSYMAPEQARGEVKSIDRRTDVYSLGATFYELLTGVPPFTDATFVGTLAKVLNEEPVPLRVHVPHLPVELETLILKCLSKEPNLRYASARALAEDLGRYLDGEPILGQRPSLLQRWKKRACKHRTLVAISSLSLLSVLVFAVVGARSWLQVRHERQQSHAKALLAERLGQQAKDMEWLMRVAYMMPLHDVHREEQRVREQMRQIASTQHELGDYGDGLVHYALGRGHLAIQEYEEAKKELTRAQEKGIDSTELHYARVRVLGELYYGPDKRSYFDIAIREPVEDGEFLRRQRELAEAVQALERGQHERLESAQYVRGLIAFYQSTYAPTGQAAEQAAVQALVEAPWMYEAQKLQADMALAKARRRIYRDSAVRPYEAFREAIALYEKASESGRSDARIYEALADVWMELWDRDKPQGSPGPDGLMHALAANDKALQVAPLRASVHLQRAEILSKWPAVGVPGAELLKLAVVASVLRAVELDPLSVETCTGLGYIYLDRARDQLMADRDPEEYWDEAISWLTRASYLKPHESHVYSALAAAYHSKALGQSMQGKDPRMASADFERYSNRAALLESGRGYGVQPLRDQFLAGLLVIVAEYNAKHGLSPESEVRRVAQYLKQASSSQKPNPAIRSILEAELAHAQYLVDSGEDPRPPLSRALDLIERILASGVSDWTLLLNRARCHYLLAVHANREKRDPSSALAEGRQALAELPRIYAKCWPCQSLRVRMSLEEASWAKYQGKAFIPILQRALVDALGDKVQPGPGLPMLDLAEVYLRLPEAQLPDQVRLAATLDLAPVERLSPDFPTPAQSHASQAGLLLALARTESKEAQRLDIARQAQAAFVRAFEINPLLQREHAERVHEVEALLSKQGGSTSRD
jgi:tRNA A-37 threonylcarbamoyl transferase component Bud32